LEDAYFLEEGDKILLETESGDSATHTLTRRDVFSVPEYRGALLEGVLSDFPLVIFNQNTHNTFRYYPLERRTSKAVYGQPNVLGAVTVSEHNQEYLKFAFPELSVCRVFNGVDEALFHPGGQKERRIAFMPRKMQEDLAEVFNILSARTTLDGWTLSPIDGMSERQVAEEMRRCLVYLSTCHREGFGLPPLEAGMSGCLVIGYTGAAAGEYMDSQHCYPVAQQDTLGFARQIEETLRFCETDPEAAEAKGRSFAENLAKTYSMSAERSSVIAAWRVLLQGRIDSSG
jgi:glycosyltransferase involved in cell wall biosynthesis